MNELHIILIALGTFGLGLSLGLYSEYRSYIALMKQRRGRIKAICDRYEKRIAIELDALENYYEGLLDRKDSYISTVIKSLLETCKKNNKLKEKLDKYIRGKDGRFKKCS